MFPQNGCDLGHLWLAEVFFNWMVQRKVPVFCSYQLQDHIMFYAYFTQFWMPRTQFLDVGKVYEAVIFESM